MGEDANNGARRRLVKNQGWIPFVATVSAIAISAAVLAQGPPQGQGQGRGQGQGGFGRQFGGGMRNQGGPGMLMRKDVQVELKLTQTQIDKIQAEFPPRAPGGPGGPGGFGGGGGGAGGAGQGGAGGGVGRGGGQGGPPGGPGGNPEEMAKRLAEQNAKLKAILDTKQFKRYEELGLQLEGTRAFQRPDVAKQLAITEAQQEQIRTVRQEAMQEMMQGGGFGRGGAGGGQGGGQQDMQAMRERMQKMQAEIDAKVLAVLTAKQKAQFEEMKGKAFKFDQNPGGGF